MTTRGKGLGGHLLYMIYLIIIGVVIAFVLTHKNVAPSIRDAEVVSSADNEKEHIVFPYARMGVVEEILDYTFSLKHKVGQFSVFTIVPDDCIELLEVNGKPVLLQGDALTHRCDWASGFHINLYPYLHDGVNAVHIKIRNITGPTGLYFAPLTE